VRCLRIIAISEQVVPAAQSSNQPHEMTVFKTQCKTVTNSAHDPSPGALSAVGLVRCMEGLFEVLEINALTADTPSATEVEIPTQSSERHLLHLLHSKPFGPNEVDESAR